jgi:hypothetical protein
MNVSADNHKSKASINFGVTNEFLQVSALPNMDLQTMGINTGL